MVSIQVTLAEAVTKAAQEAKYCKQKNYKKKKWK